MPVYSSTGSTEPLRTTVLFNKNKLLEWIDGKIKRDREGVKYNNERGYADTCGNGILLGSAIALEGLYSCILRGEFDE